MYKQAVVGLMIQEQGGSESELERPFESAKRRAQRPAASGSTPEFIEINVYYDKSTAGSKNLVLSSIAGNAEALKAVESAKGRFDDIGLYVVAHGYAHDDKTYRLSGDKFSGEDLADFIKTLNLGDKLTKITIAACNIAKDIYAKKKKGKYPLPKDVSNSFLIKLAKSLAPASTPKIAAYTCYMTGDYKVSNKQVGLPPAGERTDANLLSYAMENGALDDGEYQSLATGIREAMLKLRLSKDVKAPIEALILNRKWPEMTSQDKAVVNRVLGEAFKDPKQKTLADMFGNARYSLQQTDQKAVDGKTADKIFKSETLGRALVPFPHDSDDYLVPGKYVEAIDDNMKDFKIAVQSDKHGTVTFLSHSQWTDKALRAAS